jgi:hypothetical protein
VPSGGKQKKSPDKFLFIVIYSQPLDKEKDGHTHTREKERDHNCQLILALSRKEKRA